MFKSDSGWLHFLFANPDDHYYTDSIAKLDWNRYLYYHLKKKGYRGVFFFQDLRNGILVRTEDRASAEMYRKKALKGFWQYVDAPITIEQWHGRDIYQIAHKDCDELRKRIITFLREPEDNYAFVFPIDVYSELYQRNEDRLDLITVLTESRQKSIFVVTANCSANASLGYLTDRNGVFGTSLGDEVERLLKWKHRFIWYNEMKKVLKNRYNSWNQFRREDIERMLQHGGLFENWPIDWNHFNDYVDFIYAWYHSSAFASCYSQLFPAKEKRSMDMLERCLGERRIWEQMEQAIVRINKKRDPKKTLLHVIKQMYSISTDTLHPVMEETFEQREISGVQMEELISDRESEYDREELMGRFYDVIQELQKPWSDGNVNMALQRGFCGGYESQSPVSYCAEMMSKLSNHGTASFAAVEKIVSMMEYCVGKGCEERQFAPELFEKKIRCRETVVRIAMEIAELQQSESRCRAAVSDCEDEFRCLLNLVQGQKPVDASITAVTVDMLLNEAQQKRVVDLNNEINAKKQRLAGIRKKIAQYETVISQFEDGFEQLTHNALKDLPQLLKEMTEAMKDHAVNEVITNREIDEIISDHAAAQEEIRRYVDDTEKEKHYREQCIQLLEEEIQKDSRGMKQYV